MGQKFKIVYVHIGKERGREGERKRESEGERDWEREFRNHKSGQDFINIPIQ